MLGGREEHDALIFVSVILCILGTVALTVGLFVSYCGFEYYRASFVLSGGGASSVLIGIGVGKYTKWRSQR